VGFDPSRIKVLMGLRLGSPLVCSINTRGGARGEIDAYTPPRENPSHHLLSARPRNPSCARGANTPTRYVSSLYMWTPWRLRGGAAIVTATLIGYGNFGLLLRRPREGYDRDRLLPLHRRVTTLDRYSNSSSAAQHV
jgi:hypothetical protein